jgi:hypothetical protein
MKFQDLLNETNGKDLGLKEAKVFEDIVKNEFPPQSVVRWHKNKIDVIKTTWGNIKESRIGKTASLAKAKKNGDIEINGEIVSEGQYMYGYNISKILSKLNREQKKAGMDIKYLGIAFDESDSLSGEMFNAIFRIGDY